MAPRAITPKDENASTAAAASAGKVPASVVGPDGQTVVEERDAVVAVGTSTIGVATYATQEGTEAGNRSDADYYLTDDGKVVNEQPERGTLIARKGSTLTPASARMLADAKAAEKSED